MLHPSLDAYIAEFPIDAKEQGDAGGLEELHRTALRAYVLRQIAFLSDDLERAVRCCASPPERAMLYALAITAWDYVDGVLLRVDGNASGLMATQGVYVEIQPQAKIHAYRVDFLLTMALREAGGDVRRACLVVECDGYEWHERTQEQARRDRRRDRRLQAQDMAVFRYTGSDVWRHVFAAAREAVEELGRRFQAAR